jgi:2-methylcitrate dehydratase PrpD
MDLAHIVNAIGLAVAQTGGTRENFGTGAKSFQAGQCNAAALRAVLLAEQGFTAASTALDGKAGYTALYSKGEDISAALKCLSSDPLEIESSGIEVKKYPACYGIHRPLDGLFDLRQMHPLTTDNIERIEVETSYRALAPLVLHMPRSGTEGKFSMQYTLAAAIADGEVRLASFIDEAVDRPALRGLMGRISAREVSDQIVPRWALITVQLKSGEVLRRRIDELRGSPHSPLSDEELLTKISDCVSWSGLSIDPASLFQAAMQLGTHRVRDILTAAERTIPTTSKVS